jgi:hypothetical protein
MKSTKLYKPHRHGRNTARIFKDYQDDEHVLHSQVGFLRDIWDTWHLVGPAYAFLAFKDVRTGEWIDRAIDVSAFDARPISKLLSRYGRWDYNQFFCPNLFSEPHRQKQYSLPTRFGWCDMDASEPQDYDPWASLVWQTSPGHFQGLWAWDRTHSPQEAETFSKALAYRHGGDTNGWPHTKMLRLIGSINHKPEYDEPFVQTIRCDWSRIEARPVPLPSRRKNARVSTADIDVDPTLHDRAEVIKRYRKDLHVKARYLMGNRKVCEPDRSACIYFMIRALHEAGASPDEIASVIWTSPYFVEKHGQRLNKLNEEIARILEKAEAEK